MRLFQILLSASILSLAAQAQAFTTAAEVKPILKATRANWVAVREYDGNDLVYFTQLEAWRCGFDGLKYGINSETADTVRALEKCYEGEAAPNSFKDENRLPFITLPLNSVESVTIEILYDDGTSETASFKRSEILMK